MFIGLDLFRDGCLETISVSIEFTMPTSTRYFRTSLYTLLDFIYSTYIQENNHSGRHASRIQRFVMNWAGANAQWWGGDRCVHMYFPKSKRTKGTAPKNTAMYKYA